MCCCLCLRLVVKFCGWLWFVGCSLFVVVRYVGVCCWSRVVLVVFVDGLCKLFVCRRSLCFVCYGLLLLSANCSL